MTPTINPMVAGMQPFIVMEVLERAQQLQKTGIDIIHLEVGEPDFDMPPCVTRASHTAIDGGLSHYSHSMGTLELRQTIRWFYKKEYNVEVDPECVIVTAGWLVARHIDGPAHAVRSRQRGHRHQPRLPLLPQLHHGLQCQGR